MQSTDCTVDDRGLGNRFIHSYFKHDTQFKKNKILSIMRALMKRFDACVFVIRYEKLVRIFINEEFTRSTIFVVKFSPDNRSYIYEVKNLDKTFIFRGKVAIEYYNYCDSTFEFTSSRQFSFIRGLEYLQLNQIQ